MTDKGSGRERNKEGGRVGDGWRQERERKKWEREGKIALGGRKEKGRKIEERETE